MSDLMTPFWALVGLATIGVGYYVLAAIYRYTLHPLSSFPGPASCAVSYLPWWWASVRGVPIFWLKDLHDRYGPVVRYGPNFLSFIDAEGLVDGHQPPGAVWHAIQGVDRGRSEYPKATEFLPSPPNGIAPITMAGPENHRRFRRVMAPAFSDRSLRAQQPLLAYHVDILVQTLRHLCRGPIEMTRLYNFTTYDIMGDFAFSQPLGLLKTLQYTPEVAAPFESVRLLPVIQIIRHYPLLRTLWAWFEPKAVKDRITNNFRCAADRVDKRIEAGTYPSGPNQTDVWSQILAAGEGKGMTIPEMHSNSDVLLIAGGETSATLLSGLTYYLLMDPVKLATLVTEIRGSFSSDQDITDNMQRLATLPYLDACVREGLRIYPPFPGGVPRYVPDECRDNIIFGRRVPSGTRVLMAHYPTYHSARNFADPEEFAPQRWLGGCGEDRFRNDRLGAVQPFSVGPRNCIGQNMANLEVRRSYGATEVDYGCGGRGVV